MAEMKVLDWIAYILVIIGAVNWGLLGAFKFNVVNVVLGSIPILETIVYVLVGIAGLYLIYLLTKK
jgi:uncharacterized membrane protein YuzA (DUF378 family)